MKFSNENNIVIHTKGFRVYGHLIYVGGGWGIRNRMQAVTIYRVVTKPNRRSRYALTQTGMMA